MTNSVRRKRSSHSCSGRSFQRSRWFQVHWFLPHHQPRFQTNSTIHAAYQNCMVVAHMHRLQTCVITEAYSHQFTLIHTTGINILLILYLLTTQRWTRESGFDCGHPTNVCHQFDETDANITLHATPPSFAAATWVVRISKKTENFGIRRLTENISLDNSNKGANLRTKSKKSRPLGKKM